MKYCLAPWNRYLSTAQNFPQLALDFPNANI